MDQDPLRQLTAGPLFGDHKQGNEELVTEGWPLDFQSSLERGGHPVSLWREGRSITVTPQQPFVSRFTLPLEAT